MNIVIRNYVSGSFLLEQEPNAWDAIVIFDSGLSPSDFVEQHARRHLYLRFDDVRATAPGKRVPSLDDIQAALEFATHSQQLMVCCRAGQSRSAAVAFLICHQQLGRDAAFRLLNPQRHAPHSLIVELGARLIGDSTITQTFAEWQSSNSHVKLMDHFDDIEREIDELEQLGARNRIVQGPAK